MKWITDRTPTQAETDYAGDVGFILCISGRIGPQIYDYAIVMGDCYYDDGKWYINGVYKKGITVHGWMLPPAWGAHPYADPEEVDDGK